MLDITKKALKVIANRAYVDGRGVNYFNLLLEYCLKVVPIEECYTIDTAHVQFVDKKGFIIRYNPKCEYLFNEKDTEDMRVQKIAFFLAHEALHILFNHMDASFDKKKDSRFHQNLAMDSQVNSYLWNMGYMKNFKKDFTHYTIVDLVKAYQAAKKTMSVFDNNNTSVTPDGVVIVENPNIDKLKDFFKGILDAQKDPDKIPDLLPDNITKSKEPKLDGCVVGFETETDMPDWEVMYKFLMDNVPKMEFKMFMQGDLLGNLHSEFDMEASGPYVDRIFKGFADAIDKDVDTLNKLVQAELKHKNPLFKMRKLKSEKLKSAWVKELGKCISGINAHSGYKKTWNKFSRRLGEGFAGKTKDRYQDCSVLVDVSGSMTQDIPKAIRQICSIATFIGRIKYFLTWDTEQCGEWFNINANKLKNLEIGARGGTALGEGFKQLAKKGRTKLLIVISDMETSEDDYIILNELSKTHHIILGLVQTDITLAYEFFDNKIKVIPVAGQGVEEEGEDL